MHRSFTFWDREEAESFLESLPWRDKSLEALSNARQITYNGARYVVRWTETRSKQ